MGIAFVSACAINQAAGRRETPLWNHIRRAFSAPHPNAVVCPMVGWTGNQADLESRVAEWVCGCKVIDDERCAVFVCLANHSLALDTLFCPRGFFFWFCTLHALRD